MLLATLRIRRDTSKDHLRKNVTIRTLYKINVDSFEEIKSVPRDRLIASKDAFHKHGDL